MRMVKVRANMAHVLIIGASKGIGLEATRQCLAAGHAVRAFARSADAIALTHPQLEKMRGDARDAADVGAAVQGVDVVIQALGIGLGDLFRPVSLFSEATRVLLAAMGAHGVRRLIAVTGFGAGDSRSRIGLLQSVPFQAVFGRAYADKSEQERLIVQSPLDWTIVRPGVLTNQAWSGQYQILETATEWRNGVVSRANVADFLVRLIDDQTYLRKAPVVIGRGLRR